MTINEIRKARSKMIGSTWFRYLWQEMEKPYMTDLNNNLGREYKEHNVVPEQHQIFQAFKVTPLTEARVVLIGQDPYPSGGHANGIAFSTYKDNAPPSLQVMFRAWKLIFGDNVNRRHDLSHLYTNGVLLLNSRLTCREGEPKSHTNLGWEDFIRNTIGIIDQIKPMYYIVMGRDAEKTVPLKYLPNDRFTVCEHPMAAYYQRRDWETKFAFEYCNEWLSSNNHNEIRW